MFHVCLCAHLNQRQVKLAFNKDNKLILLTPFAGAFFSNTDIPAIAKALGMAIPDAVAVINSSAQTGGHLLHESTVHCAVVCSRVATKGLKDDKVKTSIVKLYNI